MRADWVLEHAATQDVADDVAAVSRMETVRIALKVLRRATGLRIVVVARVTNDSWTACAVLDEASFGMVPGDQLELRTTFCSMVLDTPAPLLINHVSQDERFAGHPACRLYGIESYIAVPLNRRDGSFFGTLCAVDPLPAALTPESFEIFDLLAGLIAFELEAEDAERGAREAAERMASQARELARLEERERIAMDLHDGVIQSLYAVVLGLGVHELDGDGSDASQAVLQAIDRINAVIKEIRTSIFDLRLEDLGAQGLTAGIELLAEELRVNTTVRPVLDVAADADGLLPAAGVRNLLYIAREATSNVIRHAQATTIAIRLSRDHGWLELSIRDNGQRPHVTQTDFLTGNGLHNIYERARLGGGDASITSRVGHGTEVLIRLPCGG